MMESVNEVKLKRRSIPGRLLIMPRHFFRMLSVGKDHVPFRDRLYIATRSCMTIMRFRGGGL